MIRLSRYFRRKILQIYSLSKLLLWTKNTKNYFYPRAANTSKQNLWLDWSGINFHLKYSNCGKCRSVPSVDEWTITRGKTSSFRASSCMNSEIVDETGELRISKNDKITNRLIRWLKNSTKHGNSLLREILSTFSSRQQIFHRATENSLNAVRHFKCNYFESRIIFNSLRMHKANN